MALADELVKPASSRFILARLKPAIDVTDDLDSLGGNLYSITFSDKRYVDSVVFDGTTVSSSVSSPSSNNEWSYDISTGLLTVYSTTTPSSTHPITAYYYLFFSNNPSAQYHLTPTDTSSELVCWEPRIEVNFSVKESISDILGGVLSYTATDLRISNIDQAYTPYLSRVNSFKRKDLDVWFDVNGTITLMFAGLTNKFSSTKDRISFKNLNKISLLDKTATFGDDTEGTYFTKANYTYIDPKRDGKAIPIVFNRCPQKWDRNGPIVDSIYNECDSLNIDSLLRATCDSYGESVATSTKNRKWKLCKNFVSGWVNQTFGTVSSVTLNGSSSADISMDGLSNVPRLNVSTTTAHNIDIGDTIKLLYSSTTYYGIVIQVSSANFKLVITHPVIAIPGSDTAWSGVTFTVLPKMGIVIRQLSDNKIYFPIYGYDYTINQVTTSNTNYIKTLTFVNNFEARTGLSGLNEISPKDHDIGFNFTPPATTTNQHDKLLDKIITTATSDTLSFDGTLDCEIQMSIPSIDEKELGTYRHYAEKILKTTAGYLFYDKDNSRFSYDIFTTPSSTDKRSENEIIKDSFSIVSDSDDFVTDATFINVDSTSKYSIPPTDLAYLETSDEQIKQLQGEVNFKTIKHSASDVSDVSARLKQLHFRVTNRYKFSTATLDLDTNIGDQLLIEHSQLLSGAETSVTVLSTEKSIDKTTLIVSDVGTF